MEAPKSALPSRPVRGKFRRNFGTHVHRRAYEKAHHVPTFRRARLRLGAPYRTNGFPQPHDKRTMKRVRKAPPLGAVPSPPGVNAGHLSQRERLGTLYVFVGRGANRKVGVAPYTKSLRDLPLRGGERRHALRKVGTFPVFPGCGGKRTCNPCRWTKCNLCAWTKDCLCVLDRKRGC